METLRYKRIVILFFLLSLFLTCLTTNYDYDLFARLQVGEIFFKTGQVLKHCPFSYTQTHLWYDHEWGSGVVFYAFLKLFGPPGLILLNALLLSGTAYFVFKRQKSIAAAALFLVLIHYAHNDLIRCHTFSFLFFAVFIFLLDKYRKENSNLIWLIIPLTIVWNNLHGGVASGLGIVFICLAGLIITRKPFKKLLCALGFSLLGLVVNPYGLKYLAFLFYAGTLRRDFILEWYDVFQPYHFAFFIPVLIAMSALIGWRIYSDVKNKQFDIIEYAVLAVTVYMGLAHIKLMGLALIAVFMYCRLPVFKNADKIAGLVIVILACSIPLYSPVVPRATFGVFPLKEVEFLKINNIKGNILAPFELGSYVSYKLYPDNLIYMDGRYEEVYYPKTLEDLMDFCNKRKGWRKVLDNYDTEIVLVERIDPAYDAMLEVSDWKNVYNGELCGVFVKNNRPVANLAPEEDINYYRNRMFEKNKKEKETVND